MLFRSFSRFAEETIRREQQDAVDAAGDHARTLIQMATENQIAFQRLPAGAVRSLIGFTGGGSPLRDLLRKIWPDVAEAVRQELVTSMALGYSPRKIASSVQRAFGGSLTRTLTIARTETIRAYRQANLEIYRQNSDVVTGWIWIAALGPRCCAACTAMHGTEHSLEERQIGRAHV